MTLVLAALRSSAGAGPAAATSYAMPLFPQSDRERFEAMVNASDVVCEARLDSTRDDGGSRRAFFSGLAAWKSDATTPEGFEVLGWDPFGGADHGLSDPVPGARYRLFLRRLRGERRSERGDHAAPRRYANVAAGTPANPPWWWSYSPATVDTIVARARLDSLYDRAPLVALVRRVRRERHERDGKPVLSSLLRVDRVLKGATPADTIVYQSPDDFRHWDRALMFLQRHGPDAWEPVWPGAGILEFDAEGRESRTGETLPSCLERLERMRSRPADR